MKKKILIYLTIIFSCFLCLKVRLGLKQSVTHMQVKVKKFAKVKVIMVLNVIGTVQKKVVQDVSKVKKLTEQSKENITSCDQIKAQETCNNSTVNGIDCGWKQNGCRELTNTGTDETIIADDKEDREQIDNSNNNSGNNNINIQTGDPMTCESLKDTATYKIVKQVFKWIQIIAPVMLVIFGVIDFATPVISGDNDAIKKAQSKFIKRVIVVAAIVLLPFIMDLLISLLDGAMGNNVGTCEINS